MHVYEVAYLQFCALLGVSDSLQAHRHVFASMLGLVRGRIYYNLLNWHRALALLPGYSFNRAFMERMMGVRQGFSADPPDTPYVAGRWADLGRLLRMAGRLAREQRRPPVEICRFHAWVEATLGPLAGVDFRALPADEVAALTGRLEDALLRQWRAPLVNDFLAMIWFGVLGRLVERWLPDVPRSLFNDLLCGEGGIISTEPGAERHGARWSRGRRAGARGALRRR